uniref:DUF6048 family protein n=1 Tax=Gelidibacter sp. TaxID=2018083 RepID=UPI00404AB65A
MKMQLTSLYIINLLVLMLFSSVSFSQEETLEVTETSKDSIVGSSKYGLRLGGDLSKLVRSFIDDDYTGFEINADYRLTKRLYIAGELGTEERTLDTDYLNTTTKGSYFKAGVDYNLYKNWLNMENLIYSGFRVGASTFSQTRNSYTVYNSDQYWDNPVTITEAEEFDGLTAIWVELILGMKAEVLPNLFLGANVQFKILASETEPNNFENLYIPGYNRTFDSGRFGIGFGYNISYLIPFIRKQKRLK